MEGEYQDEGEMGEGNDIDDINDMGDITGNDKPNEAPEPTTGE